MSVKLVTDSTADIPLHVASELGIQVVPLYVHFGTEVYRDGVDLSSSEFYSKLMANKSLPTTATISPGEFAQIFDSLAEQNDEILMITLSAELSATYEAALQGKELRQSKDCRVEVIDSRLILMLLGLVVLAAARKAQTGAPLQQVMDTIRSATSRAHIRMAFDTLEYLRKGGRIGPAQAFLGTLLKLKPILTVKDGIASPVARERTRAKAIEYLRRFATSFSHIEDMAVEYTTTPDEAIALAQSLDSVFPKERTHICTVGSVLGAHLGPGALGIAVLERE